MYILKNKKQETEQKKGERVKYMKSKKQTRNKNKQAISLIVLVITIIVMVILAGAIILTLNNNGIIQKANDAVEKTNLATVKELAQTKWAEAYLKTDRSQEKLEEYVLEELKNAGIDLDEYNIEVTTNGVTVSKKGATNTETPDETTIPDDWKASVTAIVDTVPIPKGFVASGATGENTKDKGLVIYEGTEAVTDANVASARTSRNQYVWVPVDTATFDTTFVRKNFGASSTISNTLGESGTFWEVLSTTTYDSRYMTKDTLEEVQAMYASVKKYGGFYIARYEAGIDTQRKEKGTAANLPGIKEGTKVYSVMGKIPYTYIPWNWTGVMSEDTNGAVEIARRMYPESNTNYGVVSTLTYSVQWDRALQWFIDTKAMTLDQVNRTEGSTAFGNYGDHVIKAGDLNSGAKYAVYNSSNYTLGSYQDVTYGTDGKSTSTKASGTHWALSTGALKAGNINNIYDMAGNMFEWTMEGRSTYYRAYRGGYFGDAATDYPVASRNYDYFPYYADNDVGFRPALYIK